MLSLWLSRRLTADSKKTPMADESLIALFVDFENLALGVRDMKGGSFQVNVVLKRLLEKGRIVFKRAYCDWGHYRSAVREFHAQGIEMVDIPQGAVSGKAFGRFSFGSVLGLMRPVQVPLHAVGIPLAAWIRDTTGSFEIAFWIFLGVYAVSCLLIAALRPARASV